MIGLLYTVAAVLVIGWLTGFFAYSGSGLILTLLVVAVIAILLRRVVGKIISKQK